MLQLETIDNTYSFHSYDEHSAKLIKPQANIHSTQTLDEVLLEISTTSLIYKNQLINDKLPENYQEFNLQTIDKLLEYPADIYLIGTGSKLSFPNKGILQHIAKNKLPIDFMDTGAACRTFNILTAEYREIAAIIFFD